MTPEERKMTEGNEALALWRSGPIAIAERIKELEAALREVADDLEAEIKARAGGELPRRVERDLEPVFRARDIIAKYRGGA